jgi:hypothetical protein
MPNRMLQQEMAEKKAGATLAMTHREALEVLTAWRSRGQIQGVRYGNL